MLALVAVKRPQKRLKDLFYLGNYEDVVSLGLLEGSGHLTDDEFSWVVAALCFIGRKEEGESLFRARKTKLSPADQVACQFFLGIAFCRHGDYAKARSYLASNLWLSRLSPDYEFYAQQGLGFYQYFCAQFAKARLSVEAALTSATTQNFIYGRALASDLLGHTLVQVGQVRSGLSRLEIAETLARQMGDGGLVKSIRLSILAYRAQHGFDSLQAIGILQHAYASWDPQNTHARSSLLLEIANQQMLCGKLRDSAQTLEQASQWIYQSGHRRLNYVLSLKLAEHAYHSGHYANALHSVQNVRALLDEKHDRITRLMALGLELKLVRALSFRTEQSTLLEKIRKLTHATSRAISLNILAREEDRKMLSEDKIAALLSEGDPDKIIASGYFSLLYDVLKIDRKKKIISLGVAGQGLLVFSLGEVFYNPEPLPKQLFRLLMLLSEGENSKAELVKVLWGYAYHPLQHDGLIYQAISRLRLILSDYSEWIEISEKGYRLRSDVQVKNFSDVPEPFPLPVKSTLNPPFDPYILNQRQNQILALFKTKTTLGVADCRKKLKVSEMTLRRDFTELVRLGLVLRFGKARSTRYRLQIQA